MTSSPPVVASTSSSVAVDRVDGRASQFRRLAFALIGLHALLVLATFRDYGITYDERWNSIYGYLVLQWYTSGFVEQGAFTYWTLPYEGAFFNVVARVLAKLTPLDVYEAGHLLGGVFGVVGSLFAWRLGSRLGGARAGFLAVLLLLTVPRWYGHVFANPRDLPMAVLALAALDGLVRLLDHLPRPGFARLAAVGVPIGLSLAVRMGSIFLVGYTGLGLLGWALCRRLAPPAEAERPRLGADLLAAARSFVVVVLLAWACMLPWWPKALMNPLWPIQSFIYTTQEFGYDIKVFFDGATLSNQSLPWYYVVKWFALVLPEHLFVGLLLALGTAAAWLLGARRERLPSLLPRALRVGLVVVAAGLPLGYVSLHGAVDYDGIRHFLFVVPPLVLLAALGLEAALSRLGSPLARGLLAALALAPAALVVADMARLHPYQYIFFNRSIAGGLPGAHGRYDTEYWGASYKEGVEWVVANYRRPDLDRRIRVVSNSYSTSTSHFLPEDRFEYLGSYHDGEQIPPDAPPPDLFLTTLRWDGPSKRPGRIVHAVERMGVPLLYVIEVTQP